MNRPHRNVLLALGIAQQAYYLGVARYAKEHRWHLATDMVYSGKIPWGWRGDGIITFLGRHPSMIDFIEEARATGIPVVELSVVRSEVKLPRVAADNDHIGRLAAEHFLARGYRHFAFVPFADDQPNEERYQGFSSVIESKGFNCHQLSPAHQWRFGPDRQDNWPIRRQRLIDELLALPRPLAVFAYNDAMAANVISACQQAGVAIPEEIAVLGVDNDPFIQACLPLPLSSVIHDLDNMAYQGAALLDRLMNGTPPPSTVLRVKPRGVITRVSTDMRAVSNFNVARALRFIADNYHRPGLTVDDVVAATSTSRRPLEKAFRKELNTSINQQIIQVRMDRVRKLLSETDLTVVEISKTTGFARPNHLFRTFRKTFGLSPQQYRRQHRKNREPMATAPSSSP